MPTETLTYNCRTGDGCKLEITPITWDYAAKGPFILVGSGSEGDCDVEVHLSLEAATNMAHNILEMVAELEESLPDAGE